MAKGFPKMYRIDRMQGGRDREKFPKAEFRHLLRLVIATDPTLLSATFHPTNRDGVRGVRRAIHNTLAAINKNNLRRIRWQRYWKSEAA